MVRGRLNPVNAVLLSCVGLGLGYVYVRRVGLAVIFVFFIYGSMAVVGWSRLILNPIFFYCFAAVVLAAGLFPVVHSARIAVHASSAPAKPYNRWWIYVLWTIASLILGYTFLAVRPTWFGFEPFRLVAYSMAPTLERGDFVMADAWRFDAASPAYGDLVVFEYPSDSGVEFLERVVGLPGDTIEIRDDKLIRNGQSVDEAYVLLSPNSPEALRNYAPHSVPECCYFVLGDNRHNARDSRFIGTVPREQLRGRIEYRWFAYNGGIRWNRFPEKLASDDTFNTRSLSE